MKKTIDLLKKAFDKITWVLYRKRQAEKQEQAIKKGLIIGLIAVVGLLLVVAGGYGIYHNVFAKAKPSYLADIANPAFTAKAYVVNDWRCGDSCWQTDLFLDALAKKGVKIEKVERITLGILPFGKAAAFVKKYNITQMPTVVVEPTGGNKPDFATFFPKNLGNVIDGNFVLTRILAPYYDVEAGKVKGKVQITYITDKTCTDCYDYKNHETALKNLGVDIRKSRLLDVSSGAAKDLIKKYNITKVPTFILSGEVSEYQVLAQAWPEVGIVAADGSYIFTNEDVMEGNYRDLSTGQVVKADISKLAPAAATTTAPAAKTPAKKTK